MKKSVYRSVVPVVALAFTLAACSKSSSNAGGGGGPVQPKAVYKVDDTVKGPNSVPAITDGTAPSEDRKLMDGLMASADQQGKKLVLVVSAAWCGPCSEFAQDITAHPEYIKELHDNGYILAKAEFEKMVVGGGADFLTLNDYLPANVGFFPSFYVYSQGQWLSIGSQNNYKDLKATLDLNPKPLSYADLKGILADKNASDDQKASVARALFGNFMGLYSYSEAKDVIATLKKSASQNNSSLAGFLQMNMWTYVGVGALDIASFTHDFPAEGKAFVDVSSDDFNTQPFTYMLETSWRKDGVKAAAVKCEGTWTGYKKQFVPGTLSASDFQKTVAKYDRVMHATCLHLQMLAAGGLTPDLKAKVDALDHSKVKDWGLLAADGDVTQALAVYHARYQYYVDYYAKDLPDVQSQLDKAKASGDQTAIDAAQHQLDVENYRIQYHSDVDKDVEAKVQAGTPVTAVHEIQ